VPATVTPSPLRFVAHAPGAAVCAYLQHFLYRSLLIVNDVTSVRNGCQAPRIQYCLILPVLPPFRRIRTGWRRCGAGPWRDAKLSLPLRSFTHSPPNCALTSRRRVFWTRRAEENSASAGVNLRALPQTFLYALPPLSQLSCRLLDLYYRIVCAPCWMRLCFLHKPSRFISPYAAGTVALRTFYLATTRTFFWLNASC